MKKHRLFVSALILVCLPLLAIPRTGSCAKVETAHLFFDKTAYSSEKGNQHVVTRGECLLRILRRQLGPLSAAEQKRAMEAVKKLNPDIEDINRIYPGQILLMPEPRIRIMKSQPLVSYTARKGDSLVRIITRELQVEAKDVNRALLLVRQVNPDIRNPNLIHPGQTLNLPAMSPVTGPPQQGEEGEAPPPGKEEPAEKAVRLPQGKLSVIRDILNRMNGSLNTEGNYYIPLPHSGQVTIECSTIPIVELDDGTIIGLDFGSRMPEAVKKLVRSNWDNYYFLKLSESESTAAILHRILNTSKVYSMTRWIKPVEAGTSLKVRFSVEWMIAKGTLPGRKNLLQGLNFLTDESQMVPDAIRTYMQENGITITEILEGNGIVSRAAESAICPVPFLGAGDGFDLAFSLLKSLGYEPSRNIDIKVFDQTKDGFNLSIVADLVVKDGSRDVLILSKRIPAQFTDILKSKGMESFSLSGGETRRGVIEKTLTAMRIPFTNKSISFSFAGGNRGGGGAVTFPALMIGREQSPLYFVDFDVDQGINCLLRDRWGAKVLRY